MHGSRSRLEYGPPYLAKALLPLTIQAQAHKCGNINVLLYIVVEACACACIVVMPRKQIAA